MEPPEEVIKKRVIASGQTAKPRYNKLCALAVCDNWRRSTDIFCRSCYMSLPEQMRHSLWESNVKKFAENLEKALRYLEDRRNNIPVVTEDGP